MSRLSVVTCKFAFLQDYKIDDPAKYEVSSESPHYRRLSACPSSDALLALNTSQKEPRHTRVLNAEVKFLALSVVTPTRCQ